MITPVVPAPRKGVLRSRRSAVLSTLGDGVMVLPAAPLRYASRDTEYGYVPDRELWYLTGLMEPGTIAVLVGGSEPRLVVFARPRDPAAEVWAGPRLGPEEAAALALADEHQSSDELEAVLPGLLDQADRIHWRAGSHPVVDRLVGEALQRSRSRGQRAGQGPRGTVEPGIILDELRLLKDESEVEAIRTACAITVAGHRSGAAAIAPGVGEWEIEAAINGTFRARGGVRPGFGTIVGSGRNGCVLHYVENSARVPADGLVLIDAGAEWGMYHGDVTRSWPASGRFTPEQRAAYDIVNAARQAGVDASMPGNTIGAVHDAASRVLAQGLIDLGVLSAPLDEVLEEGLHRRYFPHQTSHWLGLDVHDPGDYSVEGASRELEAGMVFTVEPGLYFAGDDSDSPFSGIGIRIEDDVHITEGGCEVLTAALATDPEDIESIMSE